MVGTVEKAIHFKTALHSSEGIAVQMNVDDFTEMWQLKELR